MYSLNSVLTKDTAVVYCSNIVRLMIQAVSLKAHTQTRKLWLRLTLTLVAQRRRSPKITTKFFMRKRSQCVFGDTAHQSKLGLSSTIQKEMSAMVEKLFGMYNVSICPIVHKLCVTVIWESNQWCIFGDVAHQSELACSSKVNKQCLL